MLRPSRVRRSLFVLCTAAAVLPLAPRVAAAHTELKASDPAASAQLSAPPTSIRLTFTEPASPAFSSIQLAGPTGAVAMGGLAAYDSSSRTLVATIPIGLPPGTYTVTWRAAGRDGHPSRGTFSFTVLVSPGTTSTGEAPPTAMPDSMPGDHDEHDASGGVGSLAYRTIRTVMYTALVGLIGAALFVLLLLRRVRGLGLGSDLFAEDSAAGARRVALVCAAVLVAAAPARLIAQSLAVFGDATSIFGALTTTLWGQAWLLQFGGAIVALVAVVSARGVAVMRWRLAGLGAAAVAIGFSLSGHAAATVPYTPLVVTADAVHLIAAGAWVGTLAAVALAGIPATLRGAEGARGATAAALVNAFSPLALFAAALLALTGAFAAWEQLGTFHALVSSAYGQMLLYKLGAIACVAVLGAVHWRILKPRLGSDEAAARLRRSALGEVALGVVVIAITAVLVATPAPEPNAPADAPADAPTTAAPAAQR